MSRLGGRSRIKPHCGPTNARLRLQLCVDEVEPRKVIVRAGKKVRAREAGKVLVLDDSWENEESNASTEHSTVLLFDMWHPALLDPKRKRDRTRLAKGMYNHGASTGATSFANPDGALQDDEVDGVRDKNF